MTRKIGGKWGTECLDTWFPLPTKYSVNLISFIFFIHIVVVVKDGMGRRAWRGGDGRVPALRGGGAAGARAVPAARRAPPSCAPPHPPPRPALARPRSGISHIVQYAQTHTLIF